MPTIPAMMRRVAALTACLFAAAGCAALAPPPAPAAGPPSYLFALDGRSGTLVPVAGRAGTYDLTLASVHARALYFQDRPGRTVGAIGVEPLLRRLFVAGQAPPNAAVNAQVPRRGQQLMGVRLGAPRFDARTRTLRFRVRRLRQSPGTRMRGRTDVVLPRRFGRVALFVDNCCAGGLGGPPSPVAVLNTSALALTVSVNNGAQFAIEGTGPFLSWVPQAPVAGGPSFSPGSPAPGVLAPGDNFVAATPVGFAQPTFARVVIPAGVQVTSLALYLFVGPAGQISWTLLNSGVAIGASPP